MKLAKEVLFGKVGIKPSIHVQHCEFLEQVQVRSTFVHFPGEQKLSSNCLCCS
jgi:hypothetical protein